MIKQSTRKIRRLRRHQRVRSRVFGTADRPRIVVFRSLSALYAQAIDDGQGVTLTQANLKEVKGGKHTVAGAEAVGKLLGKRLGELKKTVAVFDRAGYRYHGRVKAVADGVRASGVNL